jgi:hypothetical protein
MLAASGDTTFPWYRPVRDMVIPGVGAAIETEGMEAKNAYRKRQTGLHSTPLRGVPDEALRPPPSFRLSHRLHGSK